MVGSTVLIDGNQAEYHEEMPDRAHYNGEMAKGMLDKLFFVDHIDADAVLDYGCGDGSLLGILKVLRPNWALIGYDISQTELDVARQNHPGIDFTGVLAGVWPGTHRPAVVCSSIIHEVYAYQSPVAVERFWQDVFDGPFKTVVIRDMCVSRTANRVSDSLSVARVRQSGDPIAIAEFERQWGNLESNWSLVHYLLKYRYKENWSRELGENYLPIDLEALLAKVPRGWNPIYMEHFTLPFVRRAVMRDFGIDLQDRTHLKLILERAT